MERALHSRAAMSPRLACSLLLLLACADPGNNGKPADQPDGGPGPDPTADACVPAACPDEKQCGTVPDGCGGEAVCGTGCTAPLSCGGAGVANTCGCAVPDADGDGHAAIACGGDDCDDNAAAVHPGAVEQLWTASDLVNLAGSEGEELAAALDAAGTIHVAFHWASSDRTRERLRYLQVTPQGTVANHELIHLSGDPNQSRTGRDAAIAIDATGAPHVTFIDQLNTGSITFFHGVRRQGAWTVAAAPGDQHTSLALGADDAVHVATSGVRYVTDAGGSFAIETVSGGFLPAIALEPTTGTVHVVFQTLGGAHHAVKTAAGWTVEPIEAFSSSANAETHAVFDASGVLHVAYRSGSELHYARRTATGWTIENAGPGGYGPKSLLRLADGTIVIASIEWLAAQGNTITLAVRRNGTWTNTAANACGCYDVALVPRGDGLAAIYGSNLAMATFSIPDGVDNDCDGTTW